MIEGIKTLLIDERDLPMALAFFNIIVTTLPAAAAVFYLQSHVFGLLYVVTNLITYQERFILGLHYSSHRAIFKYSALNLIPPYLLSPFFGIPSGIYYLHHCVMHHVENNVFPYDVSSTEPFQRDNFGHLIFYWLRFLIAIWFELPYYALRRQRYGLAFHCVSCIGFFMVTTSALYKMSPVGTMWVFWIYTFVTSFLLMLGNWSQHIFVSPRNPNSNYLLAYNVINVSSNQRCFNDGYHVEHHLHSRKHWSELPTSFMRSLDKYAKEGGLVFEGIDNMAVGYLTFSGQLDKLAEHYVQLGPVEWTKEEIVAELKSRLVPIHRKPKTS
ncbi:hypothetical protein GUITHDRAFT_69166 [Guillardia theta CCMP2712]|uniref:Fatty acid desaturase domain-containing protein n=1 Tax=Guillardia theta (strain CCMP2712) TaxID=905079 RepID=L1JIE0_GUITC|nr:hypothetical protein GUITHDRAFT_69166 [Guillardia theta CCMP2712]EKX47855.1 hypothetical protein GUITHDRAFT_69166 [Guillardia theta CCMP2712]|eukprot:XP_005834835.1 hypothetical protein GUITHDRAFT_69166 [Guillardia theta CCMP2712]